MKGLAAWLPWQRGLTGGMDRGELREVETVAPLQSALHWGLISHCHAGFIKQEHVLRNYSLSEKHLLCGVCSL